MAYQPTCPSCRKSGAAYRIYRRYTADAGKKGYEPIGYQCDPKTRAGWYHGGYGCGHVWMDGDPTKGGGVKVEPEERPDPRESFAAATVLTPADQAVTGDPSPPPDEDDDWSPTPQTAISGAAEHHRNDDPTDDGDDPPAMVNLGRQEDQ